MDKSNLFIRPRIPGILLVLLLNKDGTSMTYISKKIDLTYSHLVKLIRKFKESGLVYMEKSGREQVVSLTQKGRKIGESFDAIYKAIDQLK